MSLNRKDHQNPSTSTIGAGNIRVATDEPHLVSLGGGRLSTAVTIHNLPIGELLIGSSPSCGFILNGTGILPHHCTLYRSEMNEVTLVPEPEGRTLVDGNKIIDETVLSQGAMLTIGKSNYLRFNNPAEAQYIKSTIGSNERISMPQIDFTQDTSSSNGGSPEEVFQNLNDFLESQNYTNQIINNKNSFFDPITNNTSNKTSHSQITESTNFKLFNHNNINHSPKVFTADSITVNTPAKDVLGAKYTNFTKNLPQNSVNYAQNSTINNYHLNNNSGKISFQQQSSAMITSPVLPKVNNNNQTLTNGINQQQNNKLNQPFSACYDRYPKPGSYGTLQVFPMNGVNLNDNETEIKQIEEHHKKAQMERMQEEEISKIEQERLEEILKMCSEYEKQNSKMNLITNSPIVQNRIKTNGSLPRDNNKKIYIDVGSPPLSSNSNASSNVFLFDEQSSKGNSPQIESRKTSSGYENVSFIPDYHREKNMIEITENNYIPQSPRTKIKTCISSPTQQKINLFTFNHNNHSAYSNTQHSAEYDQLTQSFEDRLRKEIKNLRENKNYLNGSSQEENTVTDLEKLKIHRERIINQLRELKKQISELQCQEDEVFREFDLEKILVSAELQTELNHLADMQKNLKILKTKIQSLEAQRNANRVMQETQQARLKQSINIKEDQIDGLEEIIKTNHYNDSLRDELNQTHDVLENERKTFEDLEFQYLEEETEWLAHREELNKELKNSLRKIEEKKYEIRTLEKSTVENQNTATVDTKKLENDLFILLKELEKLRDDLKNIDKKIYDISGKEEEVIQSPQSDSEDEHIEMTKLKLKIIYGSNEVLNSSQNDTKPNIMSKSVNENLIFSHKNIEILEKSTTRQPNSSHLQFEIPTSSTDSLNSISNNSKSSSPLSTASSKSRNTPILFQRIENSSESDPLLKLKYNLSSPPAELRLSANNLFTNSVSGNVNLNLSLESDDFEVNPLDKRVPSQDDIDRISKITLDAPITMQGASYKVKESIKEIERNRQLLLAQQGTHVIEHERQKMNDLKKKSHDEARAQYLQQQNNNRNSQGYGRGSVGDKTGDSYTKKDTSLEDKDAKKKETQNILLKGNNVSQSKPFTENGNQQRHSHPELDSNQHRPLSEISEASYDQLVDKQYMSTNDISRNSQNRLSSNTGQTDDDDNLSNRNSFTSQIDESRSSLVISSSNSIINKTNGNGNGVGRLTSGGRRNNSNASKSQRPLTRYLPIMSSHLDLRQHVEKAGHQITLCPHVIVDEFCCRGYLHKLGATFHGWSRRWFVFDRQKRALIYYSDKSERKPRGGAYFTTIDDVYLDHLNTSKSGRPHCTFIIKTKKRSYHLQAASDAAARIWIDVIITGAQGNIDY